VVCLLQDSETRFKMGLETTEKARDVEPESRKTRGHNAKERLTRRTLNPRWWAGLVFLV